MLLAKGAYWINRGRVSIINAVFCGEVHKPAKKKQTTKQNKTKKTEAMQYCPVRTGQASSIQRIYYNGFFKSVDKLMRAK